MYRMSNKIRTTVAAVLTGLALNVYANDVNGDNYTCMLTEVIKKEKNINSKATNKDNSKDGELITIELPDEKKESFNIYYKHPNTLVDGIDSWKYIEEYNLFSNGSEAVMVKEYTKNGFEIYIMIPEQRDAMAGGRCVRAN